tara:strand:+ start:243 stop:650 length:408 start_codon:yes stop_codon:yes gene_type:complete
MKLKITKEVFEFVELPQSAATVYSIRIKKGRYKNVIYKYGQVKFEEDKENGQLSFNFDFGVDVGSNRYTKEELVKSDKFKNFIAKILIFIMEEDLASQLESKWSNHYGDDYPFPVVMPKKENNDEHTTTDIKEDM